MLFMPHVSTDDLLERDNQEVGESKGKGKGMIKIFKWLYELGYNKSQESLIDRIESAARFHRQQAEIAHYRKKEDDELTKGRFPPRMSEGEHRVAADALYDLLESIDPNKFPNINRMMDKLL